MIDATPLPKPSPVSSSPDSVSTLNNAQMEAVQHLSGPCLVLAGAGSGKTRVITHKIARLLQAGYAPGQIAAITFTNKAAQEMRERAKSLIGARAAKHLVVSTFHSLGVRILRAEGARLGLKEKFSILDSDDVLGILKDAGGTTDVAMARRWQWTISLWKNEGLTSDDVKPETDDDAVAQKVMKRYEERLAAYQAVDFDDLIGLPYRLLKRDDEARATWQNTLRYVLVDEYQDTNAIQYELLKSIVGERGMFTAVGDDDQSIYGWRGATIENLRRLPQEYTALKVIPLEQNYRSTGHILRAANNVIGHNPKLFEKKLWSAFGDGEPVQLVECDNEEHEAERAVARIQAIRANGAADGVQFKDFAILYRANHQARVFEKALRKAELPYKVSGGQSFFDRAEIRDLCAWLRLLVNNDDDPAFLRAVTTPKRGIGHQTLGSLGEFAGKWKTSLYEALFAESLGTAINARAIGSLHEFGRYISDFEYRARHTTGSEDAKALLMGWLKDIDYEKHLYDGDDSEKVAASRWSNVIDFIDWIAKRCGGEIENDGGMSIETERTSVLDVAQTISVIMSLAERGEEQDVITLSTLHASKGLEWPHVVLAGVNEGLLPFRSDDEEMTPQRLEEERRLMYVGITRARTTLAVSTLRRRKRGRDFVQGIPSRFIGEMKLHEAGPKEDPREKLKALRAAALARAEQAKAAAPGAA
ncbi:ATP-dependent DNA helicase Rep [Rhizobacter sp. Root16D2]|nr:MULTISPECIES: UvrD-helicase domain-containing protein [unclassified Rhizobacter]KQU78327.1 ATP-dependent DNA helicase Rep [Rhizobacter sp. Root29]KQW16073.1 ATP-dependent DNA helicase Rep [Rhizobacter sp. Root1238]KRB25192.1 ATP-dependent DNA helicase Rep [Rhizobacter sp. Root16D2]